MRPTGAHPKLIFSPVFVGTALILLMIMTMKYWSLSSQNEELTRRLKGLQEQLLKEAEERKDMESRRQKTDDALEDCFRDKQELDGLVQEKSDRMRAKDIEYGEVIRGKEKCKRELSSTKKGLESCQSELNKLTDERNNKVGETNELKKELEAFQNKLAAMENPKMIDARKAHLDSNPLESPHDAGPGQLDDVDPSNVEVRHKETKGMRMYLDEKGAVVPILPKSDPRAPRKKPRVSVMDIAKTKDQNELQEDENPIIAGLKKNSPIGERFHDNDVNIENDQNIDDQNLAARERAENADTNINGDNPDAKDADVYDRNVEARDGKDVVDDDQDPNGEVKEKR